MGVFFSIHKKTIVISSQCLKLPKLTVWDAPSYFLSIFNRKMEDKKADIPYNMPRFLRN